MRTPKSNCDRNAKLLVGGVSVFALTALDCASGTAHAQERRQEMLLEEVTVTGSRISGRSAMEAPSPVQQIGSDIIQNSSYISLDDVIARSPALSAGVGLSNQSIGQDAGAAFANLRGLGVSRTLTLIDGRRRVSGNGFNSAVDLNTIPPSMVERIEIVTGGTSAVYGADSIAGVINVILKKDFEGVELTAKLGRPEQSPGGESEEFSLHVGSRFADGRGHLSVGLFYDGYTGFDDVDRSYARGQSLSTLRPNMQNTGPQDGIPDNILIRDPRIAIIPRTGAFVHNGIFRTVDQNGLRPLQNDFAQLRPNGTLFDIYASGGDGLVFEEIRPLRTSLNRFSSMTRFSYELLPRVEVYAELDVTLSKGRTNDEVPVHGLFERSLIVTRDNPLLDPQLTAYMDSNALTSLFIFRSAFDMGRFKTATHRDTAAVVSGFRGDFSGDGFFASWDWDVSAQYGRASVKSSFEDALFRDRYYQAYDVISDPLTGEPVCRDPAARLAGCRPLRAIGPENDVSDPAFRSWLYTNTLNSLTNEQKILSATVSGNVLPLPAGDIKVAAGIVHREESLDFREDPAMTANLIYELGPFLTQTSRSGEQRISEAFAEALVPVLKDLPFAHLLSLEGSYRLSDYDTFDSTSTWKGGAVYAPVHDIRFRYTNSRSVRAPTINELYSPGTPSSSQIMDPCDTTQINLGSQYRAANCAGFGLPPDFRDNLGANTIIETGGNVNLDPETGRSWTAGVVLTPRFVKNLSVSVDWYSIDLDGAIGSTDPITILAQCVDLPTIDNVFCPLVHRDPLSGQLSRVDNRLVNYGNRTATGLDWQILYGFDLNAVSAALSGRLSISVAGTQMDELSILPDPSRPQSRIINDGEIAFPKSRINASIGYHRGPLDVNWFVNHVGSSVADRQPTSLETYPDGYGRVSSQTYHYLSGGYALNEAIRLSVAINNLFDKAPPEHPLVTGAGNFGGGRGLYDNQGRVFFLGASARF